MVVINNDIILSVCVYLSRGYTSKILNALPSFKECYLFNKQRLYKLKCIAEEIVVTNDINDFEIYYENHTLNRYANLYGSNGNLLCKEVKSIVHLMKSTYLFASGHNLYQTTGVSSAIVYKHTKNIIMLFVNDIYIYYLDEECDLYCYQYSTNNAVCLGKIEYSKIKERDFSFVRGANRTINVSLKGDYTISEGILRYNTYTLN